jgi:hypothetical protein
MLKSASIVPLLSGLEVGSVVDGEACLYGDFSPRPCPLPSLLLAVSSASQSEDISEVVAPVLKIMPELHKLSVEPSMLRTKDLGSLEDLAVPMTPTPPLSLDPSKPFTLMDYGGLDATVTHFPMAIGPLVSLSDEVDGAGVLAPSSKALFAKEVFDLLVSLQMASPGAGVEIACLLTGKFTTGIIKKANKSLRGKRKKTSIVRKASTVA